MRRSSLLALALAPAVLFAQPAAADEVTDALEAALEAWSGGDVATAKSETEWALAKIGEAEARGLAEHLPPAPEGWTRRDEDPQSLGAAMFGGGLMATASYSGPGDAGAATVTLAADSPMVAAMGAMFGNSAAMNSLGRTVRAGRHRAVITGDGELQALIGGRTLVTIDGSASEETKQALFSAIDLDALAAR